MLVVITAVWLWSLAKKRAELFRFQLCPDFVVSVSDGRLSTRCCCQPVISLVRGAGLEGFSLTGLDLAYEDEKKWKTAPHVLPIVRHLLGSMGITPHICLVELLWAESPALQCHSQRRCLEAKSATLTFKIMTTMLQQDATGETQVSHQTVAFASP